MDTLAASPVAGKQQTDAVERAWTLAASGFAWRLLFSHDKFLNQASTLFDKAESLAGSDDIRRRVQRERLPITYVKLRQGPAILGERYAKLIDDFAAVARREHINFLREVLPMSTGM